jgi:hypothetical protein
MKNILITILLISSFSVFGQKPFREEFETDSSKIEIIRNSVYRIYEETYKNNDSIWYGVTYIDDTLKLNTEGWKLKNGRYLGIWKEFNSEGELMYTWNHDKHTCVVNPKHYPYHQILESMKQITDSLLVVEYGQEFIEKHIVFDFNCYAYNKYRTKYTWSQDSLWTEDYLGSWTEPLKSKPNSFLFRYEVRLNPLDEKYIELGICLDAKGNYVPSSDDMSNNYGFELVKPGKKNFLLNKVKAIEIARRNGMKETDSNKIDEFLFWENFKKQQYYNGQFRYYITELIEKKEFTKSEDRQGIEFKYLVYVFNPWTGEYVEKKKMKSVKEWEKLSGYSSGLLPDNE